MVNTHYIWLRRFSKFVCLSTLFLIFMGGLVTSTGSGLAVPDWPLSFGTLFPPMVGGILYEHSHRMVAATVGFLTIILAIWLACIEKRRWIKTLGFCALGAVILQGILGGITVLFLLPKPVSIIHAILAQTFFVLTVIIAYSLSFERENRLSYERGSHHNISKMALVFTFCVYCQLIVGALMRHFGAGLAIPDFPTMGGHILPRFDHVMLQRINAWRFAYGLDFVTMPQVIFHFLHRLGAAVVVVFLGWLSYRYLCEYAHDRTIQHAKLSLMMIAVLVMGQVALGAWTVLSQRGPYITTFHVVMGAAILGMSTLLTLQIAPLSLKEFRRR